MGDTYRMQYEVMVENQSKWLDQSNKKKDNNDAMRYMFAMGKEREASHVHVQNASKMRCR